MDIESCGSWKATFFPFIFICHRKLQIDFAVVIGYLLISLFYFSEALFGNVCHFAFWILFCVEYTLHCAALCCALCIWKKKFLSVSYGWFLDLFIQCFKMVFHSILFLFFFHYNLHHHHHHHHRCCLWFFRLFTSQCTTSSLLLGTCWRRR